MSVCIKDLCCRPYVYNHFFSLFEQTLVRNLSTGGMEGCLIYTTESHWLSNGKIGHVCFHSFFFCEKYRRTCVKSRSVGPWTPVAEVWICHWLLINLGCVINIIWQVSDWEGFLPGCVGLLLDRVTQWVSVWYMKDFWMGH